MLGNEPSVLESFVHEGSAVLVVVAYELSLRCPLFQKGLWTDQISGTVFPKMDLVNERKKQVSTSMVKFI